MCFPGESQIQETPGCRSSAANRGYAEGTVSSPPAAVEPWMRSAWDERKKSTVRIQSEHWNNCELNVTSYLVGLNHFRNDILNILKR